jgi:peptide/nickel transport system permease protein
MPAAERARALLRRLLVVVGLLFGIITATFVLFGVLPSDRAGVVRGGADHSLPIRYADYLRAVVLHLDLGRSAALHGTVRHAIIARLPASLSLLAGAVAVWLLALFARDGLATLRGGASRTRLATGLGVLLRAAPPYWLGLIAVYLFAQDIGRFALLPGAGSYVGLTRAPGHWAESLVMPWLVLGGSLAAISARAGEAPALPAPYLLAARSRGLGEPTVIGYAARGALAGLARRRLELGALVGGAVLVEVAFAIPGDGSLLAAALARGDVVTVQGVVLAATATVVVLRAAGAVRPRRAR